MKSRMIHEADGQRTFVAILETGDEVRASIDRLARAEKLTAAQVTAIGAFEQATIRYYDWDRRDYVPMPVEEQVEVVSLNGDIAVDAEGAPALHLHAVLGRRDGGTLGGDLQDGTVRPTLEVLITESPAHLQRVHDDATGLALIRLDR